MILNHLRESTILTGNILTIFDLLNVARVLEKSNLAPPELISVNLQQKPPPTRSM
ncbi:hypothetical protein KUH03_15785 [Sphingobacterium sp. E70]|uniref:hypothetical protein n=1 Tax=Sphingobacterium sp. E70 TaxID=2853439 RepID=UPI00211CA5B7|nr:hypothetical protein [Sphingobacterium sp. E70]ULT27943.1 hypothetical protein KUH03_15785 [Sphingobacterium sp. E70]